jgi:hypothetical protein
MFERLKNVPKWAWWLGGAIVVGGLGYAFLHRSAATAGGGTSASPTATTSTVTGGQGGVPATSAGGSGNTSVYSPTTTTTTTEANTYTTTLAPTTTTTTDISAGGNIGLPGTAADGCPGGNCGGSQPVGTQTLTAAQIQSELSALGTAYNNSQSMAQRNAYHAQAQSIRQLAAGEGIGTLVPTKFGYQGLQIGSQVY